MRDGREEGLLTVAEAAGRLGVTERRLRHLLGRGEYAARCRQITRQTRSGRRQSAGIPPDLLADIASEIEATPDAARGGEYPAVGGDNAAAQGGTTEQSAGGAGRSGGEMPAVVYRQRIADLEAMNAELRADKDRLHDALRLAQENLAREQTLRSMATLPAPAGTPASAQQPGPDVSEAARGASDAAGGAQEGKTGGFWERLWRRMRD